MTKWGQNICSLFHVLAQFILIKSEMELDFYQQKMGWTGFLTI